MATRILSPQEGKAFFKEESYEKANVRKPLRTYSKKRADQQAIYLELRAVFLRSRNHCEAALPVICTKRVAHLHHRAGHGKNLCNVKTFMAVCSNCHRWIHRHPALAEARGWIVRSYRGAA